MFTFFGHTGEIVFYDYINEPDLYTFDELKKMEMDERKAVNEYVKTITADLKGAGRGRV